eukprot:CAMPEP_0169308096 /NCGR_PEP_ID=MMETSP1017-20121227/1661_1 /TAXON_ID=342587 /ORGANISM="Karlodinium micrum, Strain CCMP2283" /LENGTH=623 /DNA_ID=CAMNT_0009401463 /DNA_START=95 /DNA_END=1961 /DNA_ORIENTATION=+
MAKHWDNEPPEAAAGSLSAWNPQRLKQSAEAAADALNAPAPVRAWVGMIDNIPENSIDSLGFGLAVLSDGQLAGKIYVTNPVGSPMPRLPLVGSYVLGDVLPAISESHDATMVSLEWISGDEKVTLRHYIIERGISHEQRVLEFASPGPLRDSILDLMRMSTSATEMVRYTSPFTEEEVLKSSKLPQLSKMKLGLQLSDEHMADERFYDMTEPVLHVLGLEQAQVQEWISSSAKVGHTVSNVQAGSSYITLYRHPLHLCSLQHRLKSRRLSTSPCTQAQEAFSSQVWSGGACATQMQESSTCQSCKWQNSGDHNGACYTECQQDWTKQCSADCITAIQGVINACRNCHAFDTWCGNKGLNGLPASFPQEAFTSCGNSCCDDAKVCPAYMSTNHPNSAYSTEFTDGDLIEVMEGTFGLPANCKYPMYPWYGNSFPLCSTCQSTYDAMHQMFLWGGPCSYVKACDNNAIIDAGQCAISKGWQCGCGCGDILAQVNEMCNAGTDLCPSTLPSQCRTDDSSTFNKCDSGTYQGLTGGSAFLWGAKMATSQCLVNEQFPSGCLPDVQYTPAQMLSWYKDGMEMDNKEALPTTCCDAAYHTGTTVSRNYSALKGRKGASGAVSAAGCAR